MKKLLPLLFVVIFAVNAHAETLTLKNGSKVIGKILSKDGKKVRIEVDGAPMTYYMDEIDNLDGASMKADAPVVVPNALPVAAKIEPEAENVVAEPKTVAAAKITPVEVGKKALILKFIDVFGTKVAMTQNLQAMTENLPADNPDYQKIKSGINVDEIIERLIPIYDKYFSEEDLKDYIEFYSSAKGKKLIDAISKVMRESVDVSAQYFQEKFPESVNQPEVKQ